MEEQRPSPRVRTAVAVALSSLVVALPLLPGTPTTAGELVVLTVAVALAGLALLASGLALPSPAFALVTADRRGGVLVLRGRPTDCAHHPHAPRAPGRG